MDWTRLFKQLFITSLALCSACVHFPQPQSANAPPPLAFTAKESRDLLSRFAPIISSENSQASFNRVGRVMATLNDDNEEHIYVETKQSAYYALEKSFTSVNGKHYTNLIYRVHFEKVPYSLIPFHLTAGRNVGLIVIITLNEAEEPVLITHVHSCGCYLGFTPTSYLDKTAYPDNWDWQKNTVFGEDLPVTLDLPVPFNTTSRLLVSLRDATHRIKDIQHITINDAKEHFTLLNSELLPISALKALPLPDGRSTSFYHEEGWQKGYVKDATKWNELFLMSWWTFDINVGRDKEFGPAEETGNVFYTSLKPWRRNASDMWPFAQFLDFWGWKL